MKKKIAIIGYGQRGAIYANYAINNPDEFGVVAIVDINPIRLNLARQTFAKVNCECEYFSDYKLFLKSKIDVDIVAIATQDKDHVLHAIDTMAAGYNLLLEKPIATTLEDCIKIYDASKLYNQKVIVCHVLRYTPFYRAIKAVIDAGELGKIESISASENVGYYHQAHSFVRGPWRNSKDSCPMIVAKCCHDMDIIRWLMDSKCVAVASMGKLAYFKSENAPPNSAPYCSDCQNEDCVYKAQKIYLNNVWMSGYFCAKERTEENILNALTHSQYDKCVFRSDNDVVDHEVTIMQFEGGQTSCHSMTAFSKQIYRDIKIHGTKAELVGVMEENWIEVRTFGGETKRIELNGDDANGNHNGGDNGLMRELFLELNGEKTVGISYLDVSIDSHKMAFSAEKSRLDHKFINLD